MMTEFKSLPLLLGHFAIYVQKSGMYINPDYYYVEQLPTMKKSGQLRALAGSRNCFFSPVNCIITHDINSYRRLAKGSSYA
uniref:Secreted protein n=2 Tax=Caenorhabditis tropicalis TaxID=1561998 RepID=A0A1I7V1A0_9PELO